MTEQARVSPESSARAAIQAVPLLDLTRIESRLIDRFHQALERVVRSGNYVLGNEVAELEQRAAEYLRVEHAVAVSSGTDALLATLMALGVGRGDEVICPSYTFFATAGVIWRLGATPVFVDCDPTTFNSGAGDFAKAVTPRAKVVIAVHLFGQCADMDGIIKLCRDHHLQLVEDAAQAIGAEYRGIRAGTMGRAGCFSFFPSKNLGGCGDGGLIVTGDAGLARELKALRVHGAERKYVHEAVGGNFRMDSLYAALLREKMGFVDEYSNVRRRNAEIYRNSFARLGIDGREVVLPRESPESRHIYNQFVIRVPGPGKRDALRERLRYRKIGHEVYYPLPLHLQPCFRELKYQRGDLPHAELAAEETVALPVFPGLLEEEIHYVVATIADWLRDPSNHHFG